MIPDQIKRRVSPSDHLRYTLGDVYTIPQDGRRGTLISVFHNITLNVYDLTFRLDIGEKDYKEYKYLVTKMLTGKAVGRLKVGDWVNIPQDGRLGMVVEITYDSRSSLVKCTFNTHEPLINANPYRYMPAPRSRERKLLGTCIDRVGEDIFVRLDFDDDTHCMINFEVGLTTKSIKAKIISVLDSVDEL